MTGDAWLDALRAELKAAAAEGRPVALGAARHSMGGQALIRDGVAMTLDVKPGAGPWIELDRSAQTYHVAPGARWRQVIAALDPSGFSPAVMQSNHDFGVAATFSVNAHGWPAPYGPFGSTVRSLRLMLASGEVVTCSPTENAELFGLVMGGYGLFGVIMDLEVAMVDNVLLRPTYELMPGRAARPAHGRRAWRRTPRSGWPTGAWRWMPSGSSARPCSSRSGPWRARRRPRRRAASS